MSVSSIFEQDRTKLSRYVDTTNLNTIERSFHQDLKDRNETLTGELGQDAELLFIFLQKYIHTSIEEVKRHRSLIREMRKELSSTLDIKQKEQIILEYAYRFNPDKKQLYLDEHAFDRWFDEDALAERIQARISGLHRLVITAIERLGVNHKVLLESKSNVLIWKNYDLNQHFLYLFGYRSEALLTHAVFKFFLQSIKPFSTHESAEVIDKNLYLLLYKTALSSKEDVWIQNDAIEFIYSMNVNYFIELAKKHYENVKEGNGIFIRHHIAKLCMELSRTDSYIIPFINEVIVKDPSSYVRQALAKTLLKAEHPQLKHLKETLILDDPEKSVRSLALIQILSKEISDLQLEAFHTLIWRCIESDKDPFVIKTALYCIRELVLASKENDKRHTVFLEHSFNKIALLLKSDADIPIKRYASGVREVIWLSFDINRLINYHQLKAFVLKIAVEKSQKVPKSFLLLDRSEMFRILSIIAQDDFSLELRYTLFGTPRLYRSEQFKRRVWRIIYEFLHPSPDKRQAFSHTIARVYEGVHHFPSAIMAEQAPTKVPGEPYYIPEEESWRPYLPLPDHFLSSLTQSTLKIYPYEIYSSDGMTRITPPKRFLKRLRVKWILSYRFAKIARLRNWREGSTEAPNSYTKEMEKLGYGISFTPYVKEDKSSTKFFSFSIPVPFIAPETLESIENYFLSAYENSLNDLLVFMLAIFGLFFIRHVFISRKIKKARQNIPLSIGGWGTRGKSGTERLKAALFNGLGYRVFSKTTGNEAMFLHSESFESMLEMYLYRPYDKATIWEQVDTVLLASDLNVDIYLWESMGLTPSYVEILQQRWMKDDIATITNTYPDHEDLQGPAGINIPQVMTNFIPHKSTLVSTEEVMAPILKTYAKNVDTHYHQKGWIKAGLISPDILERFPYEEHPYNIALVLGISEELGISEDEALKTMADSIVPDLGVLKSYPPARVETKILSFINGMSANERFGALGNWQRMGLDKYSDESEPDVYITSVINNRADRVARSRVFASMVVEDIVADKYILIGSNLSGFQSYLEEAWGSFQKTLSLSLGEDGEPIERMLGYAKHYRLIRSLEQLRDYVALMLNGSDLEVSIQKEILEFVEIQEKVTALLEGQIEILHFYKEAYEQYSDFILLESKINLGETSEQLDKHLREYIWKWLKRKIVTVEDYHATGNEVILTIFNEMPPNMNNKIIGMQNIKGTGLDFAYQWVEWDKCYKICQDMKSSESNIVHQAIDALAAFDNHNLLTVPLAKESIEQAKESIMTQNEYLQAQIKYIEHVLENKEESVRQKKKKQVSNTLTSKLYKKILEVTEAFLDAGDAVKRRKKANRIYQDLKKHHISHKRAAVELKKITLRQKGGWLFKT